jgi:CheY-like chemotaxis protein
MTNNFLIFLADDDEDDRLIFHEAITEINKSVEVVEAGDGVKLLEKLSNTEKLPDLIFLDLNMPVKNGKDVLRSIKADKRLCNIPVVIYSTSTNPSDIEETYSSGASLYLEKPYSMSGMMMSLEKILSIDWSSGSTFNRKEYFISSKQSNTIQR